MPTYFEALALLKKNIEFEYKTKKRKKRKYKTIYEKYLLDYLNWITGGLYVVLSQWINVSSFVSVFKSLISYFLTKVLLLAHKLKLTRRAKESWDLSTLAWNLGEAVYGFELQCIADCRAAAQMSCLNVSFLVVKKMLSRQLAF